MYIKPAIKGFTLIELLVAMALFSLLAITSYLIAPPLVEKAYDVRRKTDLHKIKLGLEEYYDSALQFPAELPECGRPLEYDGQRMLSSIPCDPVTKESYFYQIKNDNLQKYRLYTLLSNTTDFSISDVGCLGGCGPDCFYNYGVSSTNTSLIRCSYACSPGGGTSGTCELYQDAVLSSCPVIYWGDPTCKGMCGDPKNRCKDASGKRVPD